MFNQQNNDLVRHVNTGKKTGEDKPLEQGAERGAKAADTCASKTRQTQHWFMIIMQTVVYTSSCKALPPSIGVTS